MIKSDRQAFETFVSKKLGADVLKTLNNQNRGGKNNAKGNRFEQFFAVYKMAKLYYEAKNDDIEISSQSDCTFVDDLIVYNKTVGKKTSYQLKDSKKVYWHNNKGISPYFSRQYQLDMEFHELNASETVLVLADDSVYKLRSTDIPANIRSHTRCIHFSNLDTVNQMLMDNLNFKKAISHVCAYPDELDKLEVVTRQLIGVWAADSQAEKSLRKLMALARSSKPDFFKLEHDDILPLDSDIKALLDGIDGLYYEIREGYLHYSYRNFKGQVKPRNGTPEFLSICEVIRTTRPTTAMDFMIILMGTGEQVS